MEPSLNSTPEPHHHTSPWVAAATVAVLLILLLAGSLYGLRQVILQQAARDTQDLNERLNAIGTRIDQIESTVGALAAAKPDAAPVEALTQKIADSSTQIAALTVRIEALEKTPTPVAATTQAIPPTAAAQPPTAPAPPVPPSDAQRMEALRLVLDTLPPPVSTDSGFLQSMNGRLKGLVSVHKAGERDPYEAVRKAATPDEARTAILALPEENRAPFAEWLHPSASPSAPVTN
jgi:outer membrane murein-binding lipoprotein Lpp